jgi:murein DD-endopeptidase MepM/ murein hydrolase activator NlpD
MEKAGALLDGPSYYDLDVGETVAIGPVQITLADTAYDGPDGEGGTASCGSIVMKLNGEPERLLLGTYCRKNSSLVGAEMIRRYNTEPYRRERQNQCWKLFHDARILVSTTGYLIRRKHYAFPVAASDFEWSRASNYLTKYSGAPPWAEPTHSGLDVHLPVGLPVVACRAGTVLFVGPYKEDDEDGSPGLGLIIHGTDNVLYGYWHLSTAEVITGEETEKGQLLGHSGNSGFEKHLDWSPHLHFEMALLQRPEIGYRMTRARDYDEHLRYLWVPEGGILINPFPYLCDWYSNSRGAWAVG